MPGRKSLGVDNDSFTVRWHSVADMNTPSADIMSSPDPLNDTVDQSVMPPPSTARRVVRSSQRSSRFSSMGMGTSPRKQTFELEVGDNKAPQKLLVTVETEEPTVTAGPSSARRKLFQDSPYLPISRRREMATTTTVPLKGAIEDDVGDPNATPRKRGRPRKTNGTPLPGAGTKRKGTPIAGSPRRRQRTAKNTDTPNKPGNNAQPTPGTKRRGRPPKNRPVEPPNDIGNEQNTDDSPEPLNEIEIGGDASHLPPLRADDSQADNDVTLVITPSEAEVNQLRANRTANNSAPPQQSEPDSDIWMATLDDEPTPRPLSHTNQDARAPPSPDHGSAGGSSDFGDYGYGPAGSDVSSADEPQSDIRPGNEDTVAAGEDFSMIFMDSLPSLQASLRSSVQEIPENDIGEETSLIINNTLESLRQSLQDRNRPDANKGTAEQEKRAQAPVSAPAPAEPQEELRQSTIRPPMTFSPNRTLSSIWRQTPRRIGSSPLRHQVLKSKARDNPDAEYRGSPLRQDSSHLENDDSNLYEDSFSEIPDAVLEAATPRRPRAAARDSPTEKADVEMEDSDLIQFEEEPEQPRIQEEQQALTEHEGQREHEQREHEQREHEQREHEQREIEAPIASSGSVGSRSNGRRLPTPDDTPPNTDVGSDNAQKSTGGSQHSVRSPSPRGSSPRNSSPEPVTRAREQPGIIEDAVDEFVDQAVEVVEEAADEDIAEVVGPAIEDNDFAMDSILISEPDDHSDVDDEPAEETVVEDHAEEEPEETEEIPQVAVPQQPRLSLEAETQQPEVTPMNQLTSPIQEPQSLPEVAPERVRRPTLSPIVRAGRALQSVTSDPPSPEARDNHLRSPFRRSASRELGRRETQPGRRTSASPGKSRGFPEAAQIPQANEVYDDPFGKDTRHTGQASFMEALERRSSAGSSPRHRRTMSRESVASSTHFQAPSEGGMSWVDKEGPISDNLRGDVPLEAFARSTARPPTVNHGQLDRTMDDADDETEDAGDDMDLWEFEAQRSSPQAAPRLSTERKPESDVHRRSNLPNTWRRQANRGTQRPPRVDHQTRNETAENEEHMEVDDAPRPDIMKDAQDEPSQAEEYSLVTQKETAQENDKVPTTAKASRFDLSSFFSSPAAFPGILADKLSPLKKSVFGARPNETETEPTETDSTLPTSSMFPQLPQQEIVPRGQPRAGFFSPIRPAQPSARQEEELEESENDDYSRSNSRSNASSPGRRSASSSRQEEHDASLQELSEERTENEQQEEIDEEGTEILEEEPEEAQPSESLPSVPQKMNFTPQRRKPNQSFFKTSTQAAPPAPAPAPAPAPIPSTSAPTPPRMQLSHADIQRWQQQTSTASEDSPERPPARPLLRPLPPKNASPIKSSLRSPLKPHTPGRVVEFTSSVLSPIEQAKARQQRRLSNSSAASQSSTGAQRPHFGQPPRQTANKENDTIPQIPLSNEGLPTKQTRPEPLSQVIWTRNHWLLLDDILQQRRQGPFMLYFERCAEQYLGKTVSSQGEAMTLERWHLDCVDAFKAQVGGWDEGSLAKRLFALIQGEKRRSQGAAGKPARVMFH